MYDTTSPSELAATLTGIMAAIASQNATQGFAIARAKTLLETGKPDLALAVLNGVQPMQSIHTLVSAALPRSEANASDQGGMG